MLFKEKLINALLCTNLDYNKKVYSVMNKVVIDCVVFSFCDGNLEVLLVKEDRSFGAPKWGLISKYFQKDLDSQCLAIELLNTFNIYDPIFFKQLKAFENPDSIIPNNIFHIVYYAIIDRDEYRINFALNLPIQRWSKIKDVPKLIQDHNAILDLSLAHLSVFLHQAPMFNNV